MPDGYNAGTVTFELMVFHETTESITFAGDFSCKAAGDSDDLDGVTWGTGVAADVSITTANDVEFQTTSAVTCSGTPAAGDALFWRYVVDANNFGLEITSETNSLGGLAALSDAHGARLRDPI
jgi:hypothetical protein